MRTKEKIPEEIEIMGHKVKFNAIENPHIRRAIRERQNHFMFYSDGRGKSGHTDNKLHEDRIVKYYGDYKESSSHTDIFKEKSSKGGISKHKDYTDSHEDTHTDFYGDGSRYNDEYNEHNEAFSPKRH